MPTRSKSKIITRDPNWPGPAIHPGEMLLEEFLKPLGVQQAEAAKRLGISTNRLNEVCAREASNHGGYGGEAVADVEDLASVLGAPTGGLGSAYGDCGSGFDSRTGGENVHIFRDTLKRPSTRKIPSANDGAGQPARAEGLETEASCGSSWNHPGWNEVPPTIDTAIHFDPALGFLIQREGEFCGRIWQLEEGILPWEKAFYSGSIAAKHCAAILAGRHGTLIRRIGLGSIESGQVGRSGRDRPGLS